MKVLNPVSLLLEKVSPHVASVKMWDHHEKQNSVPAPVNFQTKYAFIPGISLETEQKAELAVLVINTKPDTWVI